MSTRKCWFETLIHRLWQSSHRRCRRRVTCVHESTKENCFVDRTVDLSKASRGVDYSAEKIDWSVLCYTQFDVYYVETKPRRVFYRLRARSYYRRFSTRPWTTWAGERYVRGLGLITRVSCSDKRGNARKPSVLVLQVFVVFIFTFGAQYFHEFVEDLFKKFIGTLVSRW